MARANLRFDELMGRLKAEFLHDKRKTSALAVSFLLMCILAFQALHKPAPSSAGASQPTGEVSKPMQADGAPAGPASRASEQPEDQLPAANLTVQSGKAITRDLFAIDVDAFPPKQQAAPASVVADAAPTGGQNQDQTQERVIQAQARALVIQSTVVSDDPIAIINGRVLRIGDWVNGFQVKSITAQGCALQKGDTRVFLEMNG